MMMVPRTVSAVPVIIIVVVISSLPLTTTTVTCVASVPCLILQAKISTTIVMSLRIESSHRHCCIRLSAVIFHVVVVVVSLMEGERLVSIVHHVMSRCCRENNM